MTLPIDFGANPLVPAVIQDDTTRDVLMVGFMNQRAFELTVETGFVHFWSRSRDQLWKKGETSGHTQEVVSIAINCECNSLLVQVVQTGAVCHTGHTSCYFRQVLPDGTLFETSDPVFDPSAVYDRSSTEIENWFGAYSYLRDHALEDVSTTSRRTRSGEPPPYSRIADELEELAGVITGEHQHEDLQSDLLLEGSQALYWIAVCGVMNQLHPVRDLDLVVGLKLESEPALDVNVSSVLRTAAQDWRSSAWEEPAEGLRKSVRLVGRAVAEYGIDPLSLIERDLAELRAKAYLRDYFESATG